MIYLKVADFTISAEGFDTPFFHQRTREYQCIPQNADLQITCEFLDEIPLPKGKEVTFSGERHWLIRDDGYCFYDSIFIDGKEILISSIIANRDWTKVTSYLKRVEQWGGPASDLRNFNLLGEVFKWFVLFKQGMVLHSSCVKSAGKGIAFSAPSGTGKSTHTGLWRKYFDVEMINDDSPVVRLIGDTIMVYGTPWSGKTDINHNIFAPLSCIVFLEQSKENELIRLSVSETNQKLLRELPKPVYPELLLKTLDFMEHMIRRIPFYLLKCTISEEAALLSHSLL